MFHSGFHLAFVAACVWQRASALQADADRPGVESDPDADDEEDEEDAAYGARPFEGRGASALKALGQRLAPETPRRPCVSALVLRGWVFSLLPFWCFMLPAVLPCRLWCAVVIDCLHETAIWHPKTWSPSTLRMSAALGEVLASKMPLDPVAECKPSRIVALYKVARTESPAVFDALWAQIATRLLSLGAFKMEPFDPFQAISWARSCPKRPISIYFG